MHHNCFHLCSLCRLECLGALMIENGDWLASFDADNEGSTQAAEAPEWDVSVGVE